MVTSLHPKNCNTRRLLIDAHVIATKYAQPWLGYGLRCMTEFFYVNSTNRAEC